MKKRWLRRLLYSVIIASGIFLSVFIWADNELEKVLGKSTPVIDIDSIIKPSDITQIKKHKRTF
jgi:transketolase C-terminal domain/subunit